MTVDSVDRTIVVFVPGWVLDDRSLAPPSVGDIVEVVLTFHPAAASAPGAGTVRTVARPIFGNAPAAHPDGSLRWSIELIGDRWCAEWPSDRPRSGPVELTGRFIVNIAWTGSEHPTPVRGRVRRIQLVEQCIEPAAKGGRRMVEGSERLSDVESTPQRFWSDWAASSDDPVVATGVLLELDLDEVPMAETRFKAGTVSVHGCDVWVMDRSDPVLLHVDTSCTPPRVTEFLLPLTIEPPTRGWTRAVHADAGGCWITSRYEVFRCEHTAPTAVTTERVTTDGGFGVVDDGQLFLRTFPRPTMRTSRRYGVVRVEPDAYPVRILNDDRQLAPVEDPALAARIAAQRVTPDTARAVDGTVWIAAGDLIALRPDGTRDRIDLEARTHGAVH